MNTNSAEIQQQPEIAVADQDEHDVSTQVEPITTTIAPAPVLLSQTSEECKSAITLAIREQLEERKQNAISQLVHDTNAQQKDSAAQNQQPSEQEEINEDILAELLLSIEQGKPTETVQKLLSDLAHKIKLDNRASPSGIDLINSVITGPQILWRRAFYTELHSLPLDQKEVVLNWFDQMSQLQNMYISEIQRANNYLKMRVCQKFEQMHISDKLKDEYLNKVNHVENRQYFHKKLSLLAPNAYRLPGLSNNASSPGQAGSLGSMGVVPDSLQTKSNGGNNNCSTSAAHDVSYLDQEQPSVLRFAKATEGTDQLVASGSAVQLRSMPSAQKAKIQETGVKTSPVNKSPPSADENVFYDQISSSCQANEKSPLEQSSAEKKHVPRQRQVYQTLQPHVRDYHRQTAAAAGPPTNYSTKEGSQNYQHHHHHVNNGGYHKTHLLPPPRMFHQYPPSASRYHQPYTYNNQHDKYGTPLIPKHAHLQAGPYQFQQQWHQQHHHQNAAQHYYDHPNEQMMMYQQKQQQYETPHPKDFHYKKHPQALHHQQQHHRQQRYSNKTGQEEVWVPKHTQDAD